MKMKINRKEAQEKIDEFFRRREFSSEEIRKIKKLAMKFRIRLRENRKKFCKKCLSQLKGKTRVGKIYKSIVCEKCGERNKFKMKRN